MSEPIKLATFNADFSATKQFKAIIEPSPAIGDAFEIRIYAPENYQVSSLYGSVSAAALKSSDIQREIISITAVPAFPVKQIISNRAANHIIDADTKTISLVFNDAVPEDFTDESVNLFGSVEWVYTTFDAQIFTHAALSKAGEYVLFATDANGCTQEIKFTVSESSNSNNGIKIDAYPLRYGSTGFYGLYANFIVYPANKNALVKCDVGTVTRYADVSQLIWRESVSFSGKEADAGFFIDAMLYFSGFFFDGYGNEISPSFSVTDGKLVASVECWGVGYLNYYSTGTVYDYFAQVDTPPGGGVTVSIGTAFAFDRKQKGIAASYEIPPRESGKSNREDVIIIYRDVIVQGANEFEMPDGTPAWPDGNGYVNYPSALDADKPAIGDAYAVSPENRHIVFVENGTFFDDESAPFWHKPETVGQFQGVKWKLKSNIPTEPTATISSALITQLNARLAELQTQYGIL